MKEVLNIEPFHSRPQLPQESRISRVTHGRISERGSAHSYPTPRSADALTGVKDLQSSALTGVKIFTHRFFLLRPTYSPPSARAVSAWWEEKGLEWDEDRHGDGHGYRQSSREGGVRGLGVLGVPPVWVRTSKNYASQILSPTQSQVRCSLFYAALLC